MSVAPAEPGRLSLAGRPLPSLRTLEITGLIVLSVAVVAAFFAWPVMPTYDLEFQLLWGSDIVRGQVPELDAFRSPTQHPLTLLMGMILGPLGDVGARASVALVMASFIVMVAGVYSLAKASFTVLCAWATALLVLSSLDYASLAIRTYLDMPFLAMMVWAAALEVRQPRRGGAVWVLLFAASMLRPETWLIMGLYALWIVGGDARGWLAWRAWVVPLAWTLGSPFIWLLTDFLITGNPLFSLLYTNDSAGELDRRQPITALPEITLQSMNSIVKIPGLVLGMAGLILAFALVPRRAAVPAILMVAGSAGFTAIVASGLAAIARYLALSGLMLLVFAGFAVAGWGVLRAGRARTAWMWLAIIGILAGGAWSLSKISFAVIEKDMNTRLIVTRSLDELFANPQVQAARRCGPVSVPNQKLLADVRMELDRSRADTVLARSDPDPEARRRMRTGGVALVIASPQVLNHPAYTPFDQLDDPSHIFLPPPGYELAARSEGLAAYVRC